MNPPSASQWTLGESPIPDWSRSLKNHEDAEAYFRFVGCSGFNMWRGDPERLAEYESFKIPQATEEAWTRSECELGLASLLRATEPSLRLWVSHDRIMEFVRRLRDPGLLMRAYEATRHIEPLIPDAKRVLVAETLVGRMLGNPDGPIALALALGDRGLARSFATMVPTFLNGTTEIEMAVPLATRKAEVRSKLATFGT